LKSEIFDTTALWNRVDGDVDLLRELAAVFAAEAPAILAQIVLAIHSGDPETVEKASHKLKGSALQLAASAAAAAARQLEEMGKSKSLNGAEASLVTLRNELRLLQDALNSMLCGDTVALMSPRE